MGEIATQDYDDTLTCLDPKTGETFDVGIIEGANEGVSYDEICATISDSQTQEAEDRIKEEQEIQRLIESGDFKG